MAYTAIQIEGGLFPADLLDAIATGDAPGQRDEDFRLNPGTRLTDEIQLAFSDIRKHWDSFQARLGRSTESTTTLTREHWIIPIFETLGVPLVFQRSGLQVGTDSFVISHLAGTGANTSPVHAVSLDQSLDRRGEGSRRSPHATVQEYLNRSDAVWGIVTNGDHLRLLRDAQVLARPTYIQFDLRAMVEGNLYSEFVVLFRLLHHTRWTTQVPDTLGWLETYYQEGIDIGGRVREHLRDGVEEALRRLGTAFLAHPESHDLREAIGHSDLDSTSYYRELLRLIYRFLFLMVVEERKLLFTPEGHVDAQDSLARQGIYTRFYSMARLRDRCEKRFEDDGFDDLWEGLKQSFLLFREEERASVLDLSALNGELFGPAACAHIENAHCGNADLLTAVFHLSTFFDQKTRRRVNYAALDVEELGSVYESLLDFHPLLELEPTPRFDLVTGSERKQTGSYYTPPSLVAELIKSALIPVVTDRLAKAEGWEAKESALLDLRVVDPASGSGHFLLAAARAIARELARVRLHGDEPSPPEYRQALRDVVRSCIYAVDRNPLAVDLCKVALWIEGYNAGLPLSFLDNHIKNGDSLVGVMSLDVLTEGIPDGAYVPVTGDHKAVTTSLKKQNKSERDGQLTFWTGIKVPDTQELAQHFRALGLAEERTPYEVHSKENAYQQLRSLGSDWWRDKVACDLWTAAFFIPMTIRELVPTTGSVRNYFQHSASDDGRVVEEAVKFSAEQVFFHWPLEFPDVFARGGFDVVLGNPPWEQIELRRDEYFASRDPKIAQASYKTVRERLIQEMTTRDSVLAADFVKSRRATEGSSKFVRGSGRFPLCGTGNVKTYSVFAELSLSLLTAFSRVGYIVPTGIATDDRTKLFFTWIMKAHSLVSLHDFENRKALFPGVHRSYKFCLLTLATTASTSGEADFAFFLHASDELGDAARIFALTAEDMELLNPNTRTCPIFRTRRDADLTKSIYRQVPVLIREGSAENNAWDMQFLRMFDMSHQANLFRLREYIDVEGRQLRGNFFKTGRTDMKSYAPLYEAKMIHQFDHCWATYSTGEFQDVSPEERRGSQAIALPRFWVEESEVDARLQPIWDRGWMLAWRRISNATNERTTIASVIPKAAAGDSLFLAMPHRGSSEQIASHLANINTFVLDYVTRQKLGGSNLSFFVVQQLPCLPPSTFEQVCSWEPSSLIADWISARVLVLSYTTHDMKSFACDLGYDGPPFPWDDERRFSVRCEVDAAFFHLYDIERDDVDYILETFPIVKRKDEAKWGEFRTKRVILKVYDEMQRAADTGVPYQGLVDSQVTGSTASAVTG